MASIFLTGKNGPIELAERKDVEKLQFIHSGIQNTHNDAWQDLVMAPNEKVGAFLGIWQDGLSDTDKLIGNWSSAIAWGHGNTRSILSADYSTPRVKIASGTTNEVKPKWQDEIVLKSQLKTLEERISKLESKIGGVTSHLYAYLRKALATSTEFMEVA